MFCHKVGFLVFLLILSFQVKSQRWITVENDSDSVRYKSSEILITRDSLYLSPTDSFVILKKGEKYRFKENPFSKSESFYDSLQVKSYKKKIYRDLYQMVIRSNQEQVKDTANFDKGELAFEPYKGMKIRNIRLLKVDVLEGSVFDTTVVAHSFLGKGANNLHFNTRDYVIYNNLSINPGDIIEPVQLADNARILRSSPYLEDARLQLEPILGDTTQVDITIITKDRFPIGVGGDYNGFDNLKFFLSDKNFVGIGHEMRHTLLYKKNDELEYGYALRYGINNIFKSFTSARFDYEHSWDKNFLRASLSKPFLTQRTKYAGGINIYQWGDKREFFVRDSLITWKYNTINQDYWIGRAFMVNKKDQTTLNLAFRLANANFVERPYVSQDSNLFFHDQTLFLTSLSLVNIKYYLGNLIYGFGVTEDIPYGFRYSLISGIKKNQFGNQTYLGTSMSFGKFLKYPGYLLFRLEFGTFFNKSRTYDQIAKFGVLNIGNLHNLNRYSYRNFIDFGFEVGHNLIDPLSKAVVENKWTKMIQGLDRDELKGDQKLGFNFQNVLFTPWYLIGFKFALTSNFNIGWVSTNSFHITEKNMYSSIGFGLRIKNESWVFETITIGLAYLLKAPDGSKNIGFILDGTDPKLFKHLYTGRPETIKMDETPALFLE